MSSLIISQNGKNARKIERSTFALESNLQDFIFENPSVLPIDQIDSGLQLFVAAREFQVGSGRIDALGFDQKGNIYVVETKLARNTDKRSVVAQVLEYGAALWVNRTNQTFFDELSLHTSKRFGKDFRAVLADEFELDDVDEILDQITENLKSGNIRFIILMDEIEDYLKDIVMFINQNSKYDLYAVEFRYYKDGDKEIISPSIFGNEVKKEVSVSRKNATNRYTPCDETDFVRSVCINDIEPQIKEQILKALGIFKNVVKKTTDDGVFQCSARLDRYDYGAHVFSFNNDGRLTIFITSQDYKDTPLANYFRVVAQKMREQNLFEVADPDMQRTVWVVSNQYSVDDYRKFVAICESVAHEQGFLNSYTENDFRKFVDSFDWTFAKTFAQTSPHEYIIIKPDHPRRQEYLNALKFLFGNSVKEKYYNQSYDRYILDGRKYWSMEQSWGDVDDETIVLNRTQPDMTYTIYENNAENGQ